MRDDNGIATATTPLFTVGVCGDDIVVLDIEKKSIPKLQDSRSVRKIASLDTHIALACTGLKADARTLINRACVKCQSHRLTVEEPVTVDYIARYIAGLQQKYTQSGGVRPFGLSTLIVGFDPYNQKPALYQTDPSGTFSAWKASTTGRNSNSNSMREFFEKNYKEMSGKETIRFAIRALLEILVGVKFVRSWPFLGRVRLCFVEPPYFRMTVKPLINHGLDVIEFPGISGWLDTLMDTAFGQTLVEPQYDCYHCGKICIYSFRSSGPLCERSSGSFQISNRDTEENDYPLSGLRNSKKYQSHHGRHQTNLSWKFVIRTPCLMTHLCMLCFLSSLC